MSFRRGVEPKVARTEESTKRRQGLIVYGKGKSYTTSEESPT